MPPLKHGREVCNSDKDSTEYPIISEIGRRVMILGNK